MKINLKFVNQSQATDNPVIAISCAEPTAGKPSVAWRLIRNSGAGSIFPFVYSSALEISMGDSEGNYTPRLSAAPGGSFSAKATPSGNQLVYNGTTLHPDTIEVGNLLPSDSITAFVYRDGLVCAQSHPLPPGARTNFSFAPLLYIGRAASTQEGDVSTLVAFAGAPVRINLQGVRSADIVMKGGGAKPLTFSAENINAPERKDAIGTDGADSTV